MKNLVLISMLLTLVSCASNKDLVKVKEDMQNEMKKQHVELESKLRKELEQSMKEEMKAEVEKQVKAEMVAEMKAEVYSQINDSLTKDKKFIEDLLKNLEEGFMEYKQTLLKVIAEKLATIEANSRKEILKILMEEKFMTAFEDKVAEKASIMTQMQFEKDKKEMISECAKEALEGLDGVLVGGDKERMDLIEMIQKMQKK